MLFPGREESKGRAFGKAEGPAGLVGQTQPDEHFHRLSASRRGRQEEDRGVGLPADEGRENEEEGGNESQKRRS